MTMSETETVNSDKVISAIRESRQAWDNQERGFGGCCRQICLMTLWRLYQKDANRSLILFESVADSENKFINDRWPYHCYFLADSGGVWTAGSPANEWDESQIIRNQDLGAVLGMIWTQAGGYWPNQENVEDLARRGRDLMTVDRSENLVYVPTLVYEDERVWQMRTKMNKDEPGEYLGKDGYLPGERTFSFV